MHFWCWLIQVSLTGLCFAVEPQISSIASLPSQNTLLTVSAQSKTPIVPVTEPITFVPVTATAPPFLGVLARKLLDLKKQNVFQLTFLQASSLQAITSPSSSPSQISTDTPFEWPQRQHTVDIPGSLLYLTILEYGLPVDPGFKEDIISNLALIGAEIEHGGIPGEVLSTATYTKSIVSFQYAHRVPLSPYGVTRKDLSVVLEAIGSLTVLDGPRRIQTAFISRRRALVGKFSLNLNVLGSTSVSQLPQNSSLAIPH